MVGQFGQVGLVGLGLCGCEWLGLCGCEGGAGRGGHGGDVGRGGHGGGEVLVVHFRNKSRPHGHPNGGRPTRLIPWLTLISFGFL